MTSFSANVSVNQDGFLHASTDADILRASVLGNLNRNTLNSCYPDAGMASIEHDLAGLRLKSNATVSPIWGTVSDYIGTTADAYEYGTIWLPVHMGSKTARQAGHPVMALGWLSHGIWRNDGSHPKLGEILTANHYGNREATLFSAWDTPDGQPRVQISSSWRFGNGGAASYLAPSLMGLCIPPVGTVGIAYVKLTTAFLDPLGINYEKRGMASVFAILGDGSSVYLGNNVPVHTDGQFQGYCQNGSFAVQLGKHSAQLDRQYRTGMNTNACVYMSRNLQQSNPLGFGKKDILYTGAFMFDQVEADAEQSPFYRGSRYDMPAEGGRAVSRWLAPGEIEPSADYPTSSWIQAGVDDGQLVPITVPANTTGAPRQGVVNVTASFNNITYSIIVNQAG